MCACVCVSSAAPRIKNLFFLSSLGVVICMPGSSGCSSRGHMAHRTLWFEELKVVYTYTPCTTFCEVAIVVSGRLT